MIVMARFPRIAVLLLVLGACDKSEPAAAPEPAPTTKQAIAPSGTYAVEVKVVEDTCSPAHVVPPPWQARVLVRAEQGKAKVNLPLSMVSATGPSRATARSDFKLEPGYTAEHTSTPKLGCDDYEVDAKMELDEPSPTGFVIDTTLDYGDSAACGVEGPSECTTRVKHTFTLVEAKCAAECTYGERPVAPGAGAGGWEIDCRC
jgi:hypothetical protein